MARWCMDRSPMGLSARRFSTAPSARALTFATGAPSPDGRRSPTRPTISLLTVSRERVRGERLRKLPERHDVRVEKLVHEDALGERRQEPRAPMMRARALGSADHAR